MGILGIPTKTNSGNQNNNGNKVHYKKRNYTNLDAVENLIRYIIRQGKMREGRATWLLMAQ